MNATEVNQLLHRTDKYWLAKQIEIRKMLNNILGKPVNKQLLHYVEANIQGEKAPPLTHRCSCRNGKVLIRQVTVEEMERLWK